MASHYKFYFILIFFLIILTTSNVKGNDQTYSPTTKTHNYPEFITKQPLSKVRFLSLDGDYTYYQNQQGQLQVASNYSIKTILSGKEFTEYFLTLSSESKYLVIQEFENPYTSSSLRAESKIHIIKFKEKEPISIYQSKGIAPQIHLNDTIISYYSQHDKILFLENIDNNDLKTLIKLQNTTNAYFIPQVVALSDNQTLYSDLTDDGFEILISYDKSSKKSTLLYKTQAPSDHLQFCKTTNNHFIMIENSPALPIPSAVIKSFPLTSIKNTPQKLGKPKSPLIINLVSPQILKAFPQDQILSFLCYEPNTIHFITHTSNDDAGKIWEGHLETTSKGELVFKELKELTGQEQGLMQLISLDQRILFIQKGKTYILKEKSMVKSDKL